MEIGSYSYPIHHCCGEYTGAELDASEAEL